ncbi:MBL fold metallo-hydrolase [Candidatus Poribacteria bacterium]|nr:MBL fold metallo-hydrolase [Candidatus Poribacteria bacterium]
MLLKKEVNFGEQKDIIKKIAENVWLAWKIKKGASFIIKTQFGAVLIDTTGDPNAKIVIEALKQINLEAKHVKLIFNTHYHFEHIAGNESFPEARIYANQNELPYISGEKKGNQKITLTNLFLSPYTKREINDLLDNTKLTFEDFCLYAFHTPGHTEGSTSYFYNDMLFVGDLIIYKEGRLLISTTGDMNATKNSIKRLKNLNFEYLCLGDGHVFRDGKNILLDLTK